MLIAILAGMHRGIQSQSVREVDQAKILPEYVCLWLGRIPYRAFSRTRDVFLGGVA